jgi:exodeoxyribonuclease VII small subunit
MTSKQKKPDKIENDSAGLDFEAAMEALETLVSGMESGDMALEVSLQQFEKGIRLSRRCQELLNDAEQRVKILLDDQEQDFQIASE